MLRTTLPAAVAGSILTDMRGKIFQFTARSAAQTRLRLASAARGGASVSRPVFTDFRGNP